MGQKSDERGHKRSKAVAVLLLYSSSSHHLLNIYYMLTLILCALHILTTGGCWLMMVQLRIFQLYGGSVVICIW